MTTQGRTTLVWGAIGLLIVVFYLVEHRNSQVSNLEAFTISGEEMAARAAEGDQARRLAIPILGLFGAALLLRRDGWRWQVHGPLAGLLAVYLAWCALSIVWSIDMPLTVRHVSVLALCGAGALGLARSLTLAELCLVALVVSGVLVMNSVATEFLLGTFRPWAGDYRFAGTLHPNVQAPYCALLALSAACWASQAKRGRAMLWTLCLLGVALLLLTKSRTMCGVAIAGLLVYCTLGAAWPKKMLVATAILWLAGTVAFLALLSGADIERQATDLALVGREHDSGALSGRVPLWSELLPQWLERPLLGHGFETFWNPRQIETLSHSLQWTVTDGHSAYLDTLLDLGLIGVSICVAAVIVALVVVGRGYFSTHEIGLGFLLALVSGRAANAFLESAFTVPTNFVSFIMICGLLHVACFHSPTAIPQRRYG